MMQISPETQLFIREHSPDDVRMLALQAKKYPDIDMPTAITQTAGRKVATEKILSWWEIEKIWYPKHLSLEQRSSGITACYKARLLQGDSLTDLTGGLGIDCSFLATGFKPAAYVERQEEFCEIAVHNLPVLNLDYINIENEDGVIYLQAASPVDYLFLDPARRNEHGGETIAISDCELNVAELEELLLQKASRVMIELSPTLDLSLALKELRQTQEVHILSVDNECRELPILFGQTSPAEISIHCVNLFTKETQKEQHFVFTREQEQYSEYTYTDSLETYLYEPNASLLKAGAFRSIVTAHPVRKLYPNSHLYTSDTFIENFPGRIFRTVNQYSFNKKEIKKNLADLKKANVTVRNPPATVAELHKQIHLTEGGDTYLFAGTLNNGQKILIRYEKV